MISALARLVIAARPVAAVLPKKTIDWPALIEITSWTKTFTSGTLALS
jgi:hypothetical protein